VTFSNASGHGEEVRIISVPIRSGNSDQVLGVLQLGFSTDRVSDPLDLLVQALVVIAPLAIVAAAITGYLLSGRALRPVAEITRLASQIDGEDLGGRLNLALPNDELGRLAATFNSMLGRIDDAFQRQRQFTGDAAHELRTPLALMRSQIDLAMTQADSTADYREALAALDGDVARMTSLVGMLLSLARADAGQLTPNREPVDLADLVRDVAEQLDLIAHEHELTITTDLTSVTASVDPDMIIQVLVNLIDNAIKNTPSGGVVTVRLQETDARPPALSPAVQPARGSNRAALITVADSGIGIAEEHLPHIFDRFYRVEGGRARSHGGSGGIGLGLAICQAIAHAHGGTLTAASTPGEGATFTLTIPLVV
jgi:signal transduction histidine kinase